MSDSVTPVSGAEAAKLLSGLLDGATDDLASPSDVVEGDGSAADEDAPWHDPAMPMAERMKQQPEKFKLRKTLAEHPFGTIKRWFGYTHFLLKGLTKVRCEWNLITLAYNLKRVLNLVSIEKLMQAVG